MISLRQLRKSKHWSQTELAYRANVGLQTIHRMEAGRPALPVTIASVAQALGVAPDDLDVQCIKRVKIEAS